VASNLSTSTEASDITRPDVSPVERPTLPQLGPRPHRLRFVVIYAILGVALAGAITGIVIYAGRAIKPAAAWSAWKPSGGGLGAAKQIADHISGTYHLPSGQQLVDVIAKPPSVSPSSSQAIPIHYVALRGTNGQIDQVTPVSSSDSVWYSLCGLGQACSIATGKPSVERGTLVRREILELALYTFKYVGGVKDVVAFMPPTPGNQPTLAVYLQRSDLSQQLKLPLDQTLSPKVPLPATISSREQQTIDATTQSRVYKYTLTQFQTGEAAIVLQPLAA
jgi:hypothetical protein